MIYMNIYIYIYIYTMYIYIYIYVCCQAIHHNVNNSSNDSMDTNHMKINNYKCYYYYYYYFYYYYYYSYCY